MKLRPSMCERAVRIFNGDSLPCQVSDFRSLCCCGHVTTAARKNSRGYTSNEPLDSLVALYCGLDEKRLAAMTVYQRKRFREMEGSPARVVKERDTSA